MFYYVLLCFIMLISKHNIIVKQLKFVRESLSRLLKKNRCQDFDNAKILQLTIFKHSIIFK